MKFFVLLFALSTLAIFTGSNARAADDERPLVFVYADTYPPLSHGKGTEVEGLLPDLVKQIVEDKMGQKVRHWGEAWPRAQRSVKVGSAFALITSLNPERLAYAHASRQPVLTLPFRFFAIKGSKAADAVAKSASVEELSGYRFCKANADGWSKRYLGVRGITYTEVRTYEICLRMMERGRVDVLVHSEKVIKGLAETLNLTDKLAIHPLVVPESPAFHVLVSKKADIGEKFLSQFDSIFAAYFGGEDYAQLKQRYGYH